MDKLFVLLRTEMLTSSRLLKRADCLMIQVWKSMSTLSAKAPCLRKNDIHIKIFPFR